MKDDFFRDVSTAIFKPVGDFVGGAVTALQPGRVQQMQRKQQNIDLNKHLAILRGNFAPEVKEQSAQAILQSLNPEILEKMKVADASVYQQRTGTAADSFVQAAVDIGKIQAARGKFNYKDESGKVTSDMTPETAAFFDAADKSVKDRVGFRDPEINPKTGKPKKIFDKSGKVIGTRNIEGTATTPEGRVVDNRELFSEGVSPFETPKAGLSPAKAKEGTPAKQLADYFQTGTETVPEENIPRTFEQLGITNTDDQQTLQEMQKALPDRDLREEYENDPEGMQRLIKLWKEGKLNKKNIHKAFAALQQKARQSLGIA